MKKIRYLKKIERKNDWFARNEKHKTKRLLARLSKDEKALYELSDSINLDSSNNFSKILERIDNELNSDQSELLKKTSQPLSLQRSIAISDHLDGDLKDYLQQQLLISSFLDDSTCTTCSKLKMQTEKVKQNIAKTSAKLECIKSIEADIKKHQETLKNYGVNFPEWKDKLKSIDKSCYYYNQGITGFKNMYTNSSTGIENSILKKLSFSKQFKLFQNQFNFLPSSAASIPSGIMPDMGGYQTKTQVQAMLPQNASGITPDVKAQLLANMQNTLTQFTELKEQSPDLNMLKNKPNFKINPYKGLPFKKRLVFSFTFHPEIKKINDPFITNLGTALGFKLTERLTPMIGLSTKLGLGKDIHHIAFTYQGIVAKAGFDSKLVYGFSIQSWYESTWRPLTEQLNTDHILNYPQPSLIVGICNTYKISKKVNGTLMIGYDFFYNKHVPYTSPLVIRMGWQ
jgi:hypothetical protein